MYTFQIFLIKDRQWKEFKSVWNLKTWVLVNFQESFFTAIKGITFSSEKKKARVGKNVGTEV